MSYQDLAYAIVEQTVEDYKSRKSRHRRVDDLEWFFKSEWCAFLLENTPYDGNEILKTLESRAY